jgi:hypothetical protein
MKRWILPCLLLGVLLAPLAMVQAQSSTSVMVFERDGNIMIMKDNGGSETALTTSGLDTSSPDPDTRSPTGISGVEAHAGARL